MVPQKVKDHFEEYISQEVYVQIAIIKGKEKVSTETAIEKYFNLANKFGINPSTFANSFVNDRPFVTSNIIGATSMQQLKENIDSIDVTLSAEILKEIEDIHLSDPNPCV